MILFIAGVFVHVNIVGFFGCFGLFFSFFIYLFFFTCSDLNKFMVDWFVHWAALTCVGSSSSKMSLREISENVKLAREYALLGNYSSASVLYQGLLEQINKYVYTVRDSGLQHRWQQVHTTTQQQLWAKQRLSGGFCDLVTFALSCGRKSTRRTETSRTSCPPWRTSSWTQHPPSPVTSRTTTVIFGQCTWTSGVKASHNAAAEWH